MATISPPGQTAKSLHLPSPHPATYVPIDQSSQPTPPGPLPSTYFRDMKATPQLKAMDACRFCQIRGMSCSGVDSIKDGRCNNCSWYERECSFMPALLQTPTSFPRDFSSPYPGNPSTRGDPAVMDQQRRVSSNSYEEATGEGCGNAVSPVPIVSTAGVPQSNNMPIQNSQKAPQITRKDESNLEEECMIAHHSFALSPEGLPLQRTQRSTPEDSQSLNVLPQNPQQLGEATQDKESELGKQHKIPTPSVAPVFDPNGRSARPSSPGMEVTLSFSGFKQLLSKDLKVSGKAMELFLAELKQIPDPATKYLVCRNTGYELANATKPCGRTLRFFEVVKDIPGFHLRWTQDESLWKHLKSNSKGPSSEKEKESAKARIKRNWGDQVLQRLTSIGTGTSMLSSCASMSRKPWVFVQRRIQRAAYQRLARSKGAKRLVFTCGDFLEAVKLPEDTPAPTASEFEKIGCLIDEDGFLEPLVTVKSNKRGGKDGIEPATKQIRTRDDGHAQTVKNEAAQMEILPPQYSTPVPSKELVMNPPEHNLAHLVGATIATNPPEQYQNENENAALREFLDPPEHNLTFYRKPNDALPSEVEAATADSGQAEPEQNPGGHTEVASFHLPRECECISNIGWDYFSLLVAAIKGNNEDLSVLMNKLSSVRDTLSFCDLHLQEFASRLSLNTDITEQELAYRVRQSLVEPHALDQMKSGPGTSHWFNGVEETLGTAATNTTPSNLWEQGLHKLDKKGSLRRLRIVLADFFDLETAWVDFARRGFVSIPGILQSWMHRGAKDQLSVYEIALREAWVYNHHTSRPHDSALLSNLQFGVVQQALRSNLLLYILILALRNDGEHCLHAYPTPAEFPMPNGSKGVFTFFESPAKQYNLSMERINSLVHCEIVVKPPGKAEEKIAAFPEKADPVTSTNWWSDLKEQRIVTLNSNRALPLQSGLEALKWDRKDAEIVESGRFSASFFHPCTPQIRPAVSTSVLRFPIIMSSKRQSLTVNAFENDAYGEIPDALRANAKLTPVSTLPDGRPLQGQTTASRIPLTKYRPPSAIGSAILGFMEWDDPKVALELRRLFCGPVSEAQELIRNDLDASATEIRESWEAFSQAEARACGPFSGLVVLQGLLQAKRVDSAGDLPFENEDQEYQRVVDYLQSAEGQMMLDPMPNLLDESVVLPMEVN